VKKIELTNSIVINRKPEDVFTYAINPDKAKEWRLGLLAVTKVKGRPIKEGSVIEESVEVMGITMHSRTEVVSFKKNKKRELKIKLGSSVRINMTEKYKEKDGKTVLIINGSAKLKGVQQLLSKTISHQMQTQLEQEMANLKTNLEA